jgi:t-SNARE complex subunit (syntaxin)
MAKQVKYYSHNQQQSKGWETDVPSMTVMGESWTIRELVDKYASGQIEADQNVSYLDVENFDAITEVFRKHIDLTDLDNFTQQIETLQATVEAQIAEQQEPITDEVADTVDETTEGEG